MSIPFDFGGDHGHGESPRMSATTYMRVISLSIAFYDYIITLPAEWRFYKSQRSWRLSPGCILFIAIRYSSIIVMTLSNVGYFGNFFTPELCARYFIAAPIFKVIQAMVSQLILGIRTINISRRATWVTWTIIISFSVISAVEWFLNMWNRVPVQSRAHNCGVGNKPPVLTVWLFYVCAMLYDIIALGIATMYLISFGPNTGKMARLVRIMLTDGLVYFVALTGTNVLNLVLYRDDDERVQNTGVSLAYALTWIMSQRILIHLRDAAAEHNRTVTTRLVVSRQLHSATSVSRAMRTQFESKERVHEDQRHRLSSAVDIDWSMTSAGAARESELLPVVSLPKERGAERDGGRRTREGADTKIEEEDRVVGAHAESESERERERERRRKWRRSGEVGGWRGSLSDSSDEDDYGERPLDVRVKVEETVTVEYDPEAFERETYREPRVLWKERARRSPVSGRRDMGGGGSAGT